ncbi:MAG: ArnT family glycosyltransferase [Thermocrinis sp.]|jgi:4-amino-4-deoxy-L-arabinose transferase-like glycosyltransferase|uniref:ArnT family glycosyltransferase n=1 Tax=Thermocrinis sp. TaxID=2024383 RepID=UPI003BFBDD9B
MWFSFGLFFFIFSNWFLGLTSLDEGRNASAVLNMLSSKDFLVPYYNCQVRFEKPLVLYYFGLVFAKPFGLNEFSLRLVSGLSAFGVGIFTYLMAKLFFDRETALKSFLVLATLPHVWVESRAFVPEMLPTFFMLGGLYFFLTNRTTLGWLFLAFAFLTKGPVGVFLPLGAYVILRRDLAFPQFKGIFLFLLVGGSWYYLMLYNFGWAYFQKFFIYGNIMRYTGQAITHPYPFYYYLIVLAVAFIFYLPAIPKLFKKEPKILPFLLWALFVVVFFSLAKNKLHHYIIFSYPALSIAFAYQLSTDYIKKVLVIATVFLLGLSVGVYFYEKKPVSNKGTALSKGF